MASPPPPPELGFSEDDRRRLETALEDALRDVGLFPDPDHAAASLAELVHREQPSIQLAKRLLGVDADSNSWKQLMGQAPQLPPWLMEHFRKGRPSYTGKLETLLFLAMRFQQQRLQQKEPSDDAGQDEPPAVAAAPSAAAAALELPSFLSEKQRTAIALCYAHLQKDYDNRRHAMLERLAISLSDLGDGVLVAGEDTAAEPTTSHEDTAEALIRHFSQAHSRPAGATLASDAPLAPPLAVGSADRGGRLDEAASRVTMPEWTEERRPTQPPAAGGFRGGPKKGGGHAHGQHRKRGNGEAHPTNSPRKKTHDNAAR